MSDIAKMLERCLPRPYFEFTVMVDSASNFVPKIFVSPPSGVGSRNRALQIRQVRYLAPMCASCYNGKKEAYHVEE